MTTMTPTSKTFAAPALRHARASRMKRLLAATCAAAFLAVAGLSAGALAQASAPVDTSKLPRVMGIKQLVALPQTTIILASEPVPAAARAALALLESAGWQRYLAPGSEIVPTPTSETHNLKKGAQALTLFVQVAPAHNNATSVSYTAVPLTRDLPFPANASGIRFSPERLHLDAVAPQAHDALLAFYRTELLAAGWALHSASDGSASMVIPTETAMHHAFFTHGALGALHVRARKLEDGRSSIAVRQVPASVLPGAQVARTPEPVAPRPAAPQPNPHADAHDALNKTVDSMAQDLLKQALQPPPKGAGIESALAAARAAGVRVDMPAKSSSADAPAREPAKAVPLERDEVGGLPVPKSSSSRAQEKTPLRTHVQALVKASPDEVLAFYRDEAGTLGWRETAPARQERDRTILAYASAEGPVVLTLERKGRDIAISLLLRNEAAARKSGLMPKAGQAKIMFGSMLDADATVVVGGRTLKVAAGVGSKGPDGPSLDVAPGPHKVTVKSPGKPDVVEVVTVRADDIWGLLLGPGGALPLPMY